MGDNACLTLIYPVTRTLDVTIHLLIVVDDVILIPIIGVNSPNEIVTPLKVMKLDQNQPFITGKVGSWGAVVTDRFKKVTVTLDKD